MKALGLTRLKARVTALSSSMAVSQSTAPIYVPMWQADSSPLPANGVGYRLYSPHVGQRRVHECASRFRVVPCGRRWGKTRLATNDVAWHALAKPGTGYGWVSPWFRQAKLVYRAMRAGLHDVIAYKSDSDLRVEFKNGSVIQFFSADNPDSLRGNGFHGIVIDEAGDTLRDESVWFDAIRPTLADYQGWALIVGTPKGRNLFWRMFTWGEDDTRSSWQSFTAPTSDNPHIAQSEIDAAKRELPTDSFRQEYLAKFVEYGAGVFHGLDACIYGSVDETLVRLDGHRYVLGWDPAKYQDYSVLTLIDCNIRRVMAVWRDSQTDYSLQIKQVVSLATQFGAHVIMDVTGVGAPLYEQLANQSSDNHFTCEEFLFTNATKKQLIENLQIAIQNREIEIPDIPVAINELRAFEYNMTKAGSLSYSAPSGMHDDCVISIALACLAASTPKNTGGGMILLTGFNDEEDEDSWFL